MTVLTEFVLPVTSSVTAAGVLYIAREAHNVAETVEENRKRSEQNAERSRQNKERSLINRVALAQEGMTAPPSAKISPNDGNAEESHG